MILSGKSIYEQLGQNIRIDPFRIEQLNPNSYNLRLHHELLVYDQPTLDMKRREAPPTRLTIPEEGAADGERQAVPGPHGESTPKRTAACPWHCEGRFVGGATVGCRFRGTSRRALATWASLVSGRWRCSACSRCASLAGCKSARYFTTASKRESKTYRGGESQNNQGVQPSLLFKDFE